MRIDAIKLLLVGPSMPLAQARHERLGRAVALAVFASDPLSSVAYATEEILLVLVLAGTLLAETMTEEHPHSKPNLTPSTSHTGYASTFARARFKIVARHVLPRPIVRYDLEAITR